MLARYHEWEVLCCVVLCLSTQLTCCDCPYAPVQDKRGIVQRSRRFTHVRRRKKISDYLVLETGVVFGGRGLVDCIVKEVNCFVHPYNGFSFFLIHIHFVDFVGCGNVVERKGGERGIEIEARGRL